MTDGIIGTPNADTLAGTEADDIIVGGGDNDVIDGGAGNDSIRGDGESGGGTVEIRDFIVNGSFEQVADGSGDPTMISTFNSNHDDVHDRTEVGFYEVVPGWQTSGDNIEIHGDQTGIANSPDALDGNFKLEIDGGGTDPFFNNTNVFQDVEGMLDGETYTLNFNLLNRDGDWGDVVKVYFGGEEIAVIEQTATEWCEYGYEVTGGAGDGSDQLEFRIWTYDEHAIFVDSVSLVGPANVAVEDVPGDDIIAGGAGDDTIDGEEGNDSIDGGEGADLIEGGEGNDTLSGGDDGLTGGEEFCAENGVAGFESVGVTLSALDFDGTPATVTDTSRGIGVAGGNPVGDQINHSSDGQTQTLVADLGQTVESATLTVTHFFPDEGNGGEAGQWRALDADGNEVATGTFGPDDVITDHDLGNIPAVGRFTIDGIGEFASIELSGLPYVDGDDDGGSDSSDYFLYSIKFTTPLVDADCGDGDSDTIHGGVGDDEISGNGGDDVLSGDAGDDLIAGGAGNDSIDGGTGNDTISGDGGAVGTGGEQEIVIPQGENGLYDVAGRDSITLTMDYLGGSAGFSNSFGFYLADESGTPISGEIVKANVKTSDAAEGADVLTFSLDAAQLGGAAQLGMFLIPNGGSLNPDLTDGDAVTFADDGNGELQALVDGIPVAAASSHGPVFFSDTSLNGDTIDHEIDNGLPGNSNWEDLENGGDHDYNDVNWQIDVTTTEICEVGHDDTINGGEGDDEISGDEGNDVIAGGGGADLIAGGEGDDTIIGDDASELVCDPVVLPVFQHAISNVVLYLADDNGSGAITKVKIEDFPDGSDEIHDPNELPIASFLESAFPGSSLVAISIKAGANSDPDLGPGEGQLFILDTSVSESDLPLADSADDEFSFVVLDGFTGGLTNQTTADSHGNDTIDGGAGDDLIDGNRGDDELLGNEGNDTLFGNIGNDTMLGGDGDDLMSGNAGADVIDGGAGVDTADYSAAQGTVLASLNHGIVEKDGDGWIDSLENIENLTGSEHNDSLLGDDGANVILGGDGDDTIDGFGGEDTLDGGAGSNTVSFQSAGGSVLVALQNALAQDENGENIALNGFSSAIGSDFDDSMTGDDGDNTLIGGGGNDDIRGNDGADLLFGDGVTESFGDTDTLIVHAHGSPLDGVFPIMEVSVGGVVVGTAQVTQSLNPYDFDVSGLTDEQRAGEVKITFLNDATDGGDCDNSFGPDCNEDRNLFVEAIEFNGAMTDASAGELSFEPDSFVSYQSGGANFDVEDINEEINDSGDNRPNGGNVYTGFVVFAGLPVDGPFDGPNADYIVGNDGNDTQYGGFDNDTVFGGLGDDSLYGDEGDDLVCAFEDDDQAFGGAGNDFVEGNDGNDTVYGGSGNDKVAGNAGTDIVFGDEGNDDVDGGAGDDLVFGGLGADSVGGGDGNDEVYGGEGDDTVRGNKGDDTLFGGAGADSVLGEAGNDVAFGGDGNDSLKGGLGNDSLSGDAGADFLDGEAGDDELTGGDGSDTLRGGDDNDALFGGIGNDIVKGDAGDDTADGGDGDDQVEGGAGNDTVLGGAGVDKVSGQDGDDLVDGGEGDDTVRGNAGNDTLLGGLGSDFMEGGADNDQLSGGDDNDTIRGDAGQDALFGDAGNDVLRGGADDDTMSGGLGDDFMVGDVGNDILTGDDGADSLRGGDGDDNLVGGAGSDNLRGNLGNDELSGGLGDDFMDGEDGDDLLFGGDGNDVLRGNDGEDTIEGGDGDDQLRGGLNGDSLSGGAGNDFINADGGKDFVDGGDGNDNLFGAGGDDTILGGAGDDRVRGQDGADNLDGGAGNDFMTGDNGDDFMTGGDGDDDLRGNVGFDTLFGGNGSDNLVGGAGQKDTYLFGRRTDLEANDDTIIDSGAGNQLNIFGTGSLAELSFTDLGGGNVQVAFLDGSGSISFDADAVTELNLLDTLAGTVTTATTLLNNGASGIDVLDDQNNLLFTI
ncbi:MAG: carbohydrate-binding domain-containing protein [Minwuia sp.]|nr:carbohydrate-binding domain-containing protein [Minwuia sp.]